MVPGRTCWRIEQTNRRAVIVDEYFRFAKAAMLKAKHTIMLIGWDFDTRIKCELLDPERPSPSLVKQVSEGLSKLLPGFSNR